VFAAYYEINKIVYSVQVVNINANHHSPSFNCYRSLNLDVPHTDLIYNLVPTYHSTEE